MAKNSHFRVLALTATPGSDIDAVQKVVDALHISHIEMRSEKSPDIVPYLHIKHVKLHIILMTEDIVKLRDMLSKIMQVDHLWAFCSPYMRDSEERSYIAAD